MFFDSAYFDGLLQIDESETVAVARYIARQYGLLLGASTCTVLAGMYEDHQKPSDRLVAVSPDLGTKYIETMFNDSWCDEKFGDQWRYYDFFSRSQIAKETAQTGA